MNTAFRTVRFTVGWTITAAAETATAGVADLTGLDARAEKWLPGVAADRPPDPARRPASEEPDRFGTRHRVALCHRRHEYHPNVRHLPARIIRNGSTRCTEATPRSKTGCGTNKAA
jgi:hypothetical protein